MESKTIQLTDGIQIPQLGFGTSGLGNQATESIVHALKIGYRHIDTADIYGTHENVGEGIGQSGVPRKDIFITTKLWSHSVEKDKVAPAVDRFLDELKADYIDLLLIHWPSKSVPVKETLPAMEEVRRAGKIRTIGVSNFGEDLVKRSLATGIQVVNNQIEYSLTHRPYDILEYCFTNNVTVTAYSPLKTRGNGASGRVLADLSKKYSCGKAEVLLAWLRQKGMIAIPRSTNPEHIEANFHSLELELEEADIEKLDKPPRFG